MNQQEIKSQISYLEKRIENSKADRNIEGYTLKSYYDANELYIQMLEKAQMQLITNLNQSLINKNK
jgi:hypothetical protein